MRHRSGARRSGERCLAREQAIARRAPPRVPADPAAWGAAARGAARAARGTVRVGDRPVAGTREGARATPSLRPRVPGRPGRCRVRDGLASRRNRRTRAGRSLAGRCGARYGSVLYIGLYKEQYNITMLPSRRLLPARIAGARRAAGARRRQLARGPRPVLFRMKQSRNSDETVT